MRAAGVTRFVEVGPGRVLSGLIRRIAPDAEAIPLDDPNAPGGLADPDATAGRHARRPDRRHPTATRPSTPRQETTAPCASPTSPAASP